MKTYTIKYTQGKFLWKELGEKPKGKDPLSTWECCQWRELFHSKEGWGEVDCSDQIVDTRYFHREDIIQENDYIHLSEDQVRIEGNKLYLV